MLFNSVVFLIYLPIIIGIFYLLKKTSYKKLFLIIASYVFYGYWDWRFLFLLLISTIVDFILAKKIDRTDDKKIRKRFLITSISINLGILAIFKYFNFFIASLVDMGHSVGYELDFVTLYIILPVGISFYTFQTMSYTIDVYNKKIDAETNFANMALYVSFFPQLVAGPIEKAAHLLPQIRTLKKAKKADFKEGFMLITMGMMKKVLIGDTCGLYVDHIFSEAARFESYELISALLLFTIQIYADFSGYSSIGRGIAKMLGIDLVHNFQQPYLSRNITEFWRRWHISLSSWLKEYLYIGALGGNRISNNRTYINLMLTMLLGGLWHGASWNFVIWGGLHGIGLALHKLILKDNSPVTSYSYTNIKGLFSYLFNTFFTFIFVIITWLFFRVTSFEEIIIISKQIAHFTWTYESSVLLGIVSVYYIVSFGLDICEYKTKSKTFLLSLQPEKWIGISIALWISIIMYMLSVVKPLPFVYFQF